MKKYKRTSQNPSLQSISKIDPEIKKLKIKKGTCLVEIDFDQFETKILQLNKEKKWKTFNSE